MKAVTPNFTSVNNENRFTDTDKLIQQLTHKQKVKALIIPQFIMYSAIVALDLAVRFRLTKYLAGDAGQLANLT